MNNELNEKLEAVRKTAEEKAEEISEVVEEVKLEAAEKFEEAGSLSEEVKEKLDKTLAALDETLKQDKVENPESGIQLTLKPSDAVLAARREVKEKYGEKDDKTVELKEKVTDKYEKAKKDVSETFGDLKETAMNVGGKIGEKSREAAEKFKDTGAGKALLGDDGKFDMDDVGRIGSDILEAGEKAVEKVASFLKDLTDK